MAGPHFGSLELEIRIPGDDHRVDVAVGVGDYSQEHATWWHTSACGDHLHLSCGGITVRHVTAAEFGYALRIIEERRGKAKAISP